MCVDEYKSATWPGPRQDLLNEGIWKTGNQAVAQVYQQSFGSLGDAFGAAGRLSYFPAGETWSITSGGFHLKNMASTPQSL